MKHYQKCLAFLLALCLLTFPLVGVQPSYAQNNDESTVQLTVDSSQVEGGRILLEKEVVLTEGATAYSVLVDALGDNLEVDHTSYGPYVKSVLGLREFVAGPTSGWMFEVNGAAPDRGAGAYMLQKNDHVRWYYTVFEPMPEPPKDQLVIESALADLETYLNDHSVSSPWHTIAYRQNHGLLPAYLIQDALERREAALQSNKLTDLEKSILEIQALKRSPNDTTVDAMLETLLSTQDLEAQGLNGLIFALLAVNSEQGAAKAPDVWVERLLAAQNPKGSFSLVEDMPGEIDITAMALQALAPYADRYEEQVEKALDWLEEKQEENGGYVANGVANAESTAQVLLALQALNIYPTGEERFEKPEGNLIENLLSFQREDGSFAHIVDGPADALATEQAHLALVGLKRQRASEGPLFKFEEFVPIPFIDQDRISPWAREAVESAVAAGLLAGYPDGTLRPQNVLNRAEMVVLLSRVYAWEFEEGKESGVFVDVPSTAWYAEVVEGAARQGYVSGVTENTFAPMQDLNRQTMAALLMRDYHLPTTEIWFEYDDQAAISDWAMNDVQYTSNAGLMVGVGENRFAPLDPITREQGAAILWRLHNQLHSAEAETESVEAA